MSEMNAAEERVEHMCRTICNELHTPEYGTTISRTFQDEATAKLWGIYKENLIQEMESFEVPNEQVLEFEDAIELKKEELRGTKEANDYNALFKCFSSILNLPISSITSELLEDLYNNMLKEKVMRGGNLVNPEKERTGKVTLISPFTILRRFRMVSAVFSNLQKNGIRIQNPAETICKALSHKLKKKDELGLTDS